MPRPSTALASGGGDLARRLAGILPLGIVIATAASSCDSDPTREDPGAPDPSTLSAQLVAQGLESPVHLTTAPGTGDPRLFVVEQAGRVRILDPDGGLRPTPFLDLTDRVGCCGERGLLSLAFHPAYAANGFFFVNYTGTDGDTRVERHSVSGDPDVADPASARLILEVEQPFQNHNGGLNTFGPDGMLYIGLGDGGSGGDPRNNGQSPNTLLGTILRLDVDRGDPYAIPDDNPFVGLDQGQPEIWAYGLRNPWRFSFDPVTEEIYISDVGQSEWEEINRRPMDEGGLNYGWNVMEGRDCYEASSCDQGGLVLPVAQYSHDEGCSITGGYVYRGSRIPALQGHYLFADYCGGWVRSLAPGEDGTVVEWGLGDLGRITSFGQDGDAELYILTTDGDIYSLVEGDGG